MLWCGGSGIVEEPRPSGGGLVRPWCEGGAISELLCGAGVVMEPYLIDGSIDNPWCKGSAVFKPRRGIVVSKILG